MIDAPTSKDIKAMAAIHMSTLEVGLTAKLGPKYLETSFYPYILSLPETLPLVYRNHGKIAGFAIFTTDTKRLRNALRARKWTDLGYILKGIIRHPLILRDLARILLSKDSDVDHGPELFIIAVERDRQNTQIGSQLLLAGLELLSKSSDGKASCLVRTHSFRAENFYLKHGFVKIRNEPRGSFSVSVLKITKA